MYCKICGRYIEHTEEFCNRCGDQSNVTVKSGTGDRIEFSLQPLIHDHDSRTVSIPLKLFLGTLGLLGAILISVLAYVCYSMGLLPF